MGVYGEGRKERGEGGWKGRGAAARAVRKGEGEAGRGGAVAVAAGRRAMRPTGANLPPAS